MFRCFQSNLLSGKRSYQYVVPSWEISGSSRLNFIWKMIVHYSFYILNLYTNRLTIPITGLVPLKMPLCVATVTSNSVEFNSADDIMYSKVASYTGLQSSLITMVLRLVSLCRPGNRYNFTYGSGIFEGSSNGRFLKEIMQ